MLLFRLDLKELTVACYNNPLNKLTRTEVIVDGKRRDRDTQRYFWTDELDELRTKYDRALNQRKLEISREITALSHELESLDSRQLINLKLAADALRESNNDIFN